MSRKLHIGGKVRADGWEVVNALPGPYVDHVCNANDFSRFDSNTFSAIYASHVVEHFDYRGELQKTLKEWLRVLEPGGKLYISVPDLDILAKLLLAKNELTVKERFEVMCMIFGGHMDKYDYHLTGLNEDFMTIILKNIGYVNILRVNEFGLFDDTSCWRFKGVAISLNMSAEKPAAD